VDNEILKVLVENGDVKVLILLMAYFIKTFGNKVDRLADNVADIHKDMAVIFERNDANLIKTNKNEKDIILLRERNHDFINNYISKIELNEMRIKDLEEKQRSLK